MAPLTTTFERLHNAGACVEGYSKLAHALGGVEKYGRTTSIPLSLIVISNGLDDALWATRAVPPEQVAECEKVLRLFLADSAERVLPLYERWYPLDTRPRRAIETARRFARGDATALELAEAETAAMASTWATTEPRAQAAALAA